MLVCMKKKLGSMLWSLGGLDSGPSWDIHGGSPLVYAGHINCCCGLGMQRMLLVILDERLHGTNGFDGNAVHLRALRPIKRYHFILKKIVTLIIDQMVPSLYSYTKFHM